MPPPAVHGAVAGASDERKRRGPKASAPRKNAPHGRSRGKRDAMKPPRRGRVKSY